MSLNSTPTPIRFLRCKRLVRRSTFCAVTLFVFAALPLWSQVQQTTMFDVKNPKNQRWYPVEARRIYTSACDLVARSIRPDAPPRLQPRFRLVLGADENEFVRDGRVNEIRLKSWNPEKFAEGVVIGAIRDLLHADELAKIAHQSVVLADSTLDVRELRER
jgi:hypothetical protein